MTEEELFNLVREDLQTGLEEWFAISDIVADDPERSPLEEGRAVIVTNDDGTQTLAVGWQIISTHIAPVHGIAPRGDGEIVIRGATFLRVDEGGEPRFHRYIEWHDVYAQLGTTHGGRRVLSPDEDVARQQPSPND